MDNITIDKNFSIKNAMKQLDLTAEKILFVIDDKKTLLGVLTDGDIRRAILSGKNLMESIDGVYNDHPISLNENQYSVESAKKIFIDRKVEIIPIVDQHKKLVNYISWNKIFGTEKTIKTRKLIDIPVVIMAGGKGTRMAPFTNILPKPLIPIGEKTILELIIDGFYSFGINNYHITVNYRGEMIKAYFDSIEKNYEVNYIWEKEFCGTAGSLILLDNIEDTFIVSNCDIIVKADYSDVINYHMKNNASLTVLSAIQHHTVPYGVINFERGGIVTGVQEKPEFSFPINTGVYVLQKEVLPYISPGKMFHMTDLIAALIDDNKKVFTYPVNENDYVDIGQWEEYRNAVNRLSNTNL